MSNTAPSRADPVVVFPLCQWCPPLETSQPHPPPPLSESEVVRGKGRCGTYWTSERDLTRFWGNWSLTHWGWYKITAISQMTPLTAFSWMGMYEFRIRFHWSLFLKFVRINNIPALVQIMAWRRPGDKPLSEPMMVSLLTYICITRPQWVNSLLPGATYQYFAKEGRN